MPPEQDREDHTTITNHGPGLANGTYPSNIHPGTRWEYIVVALLSVCMYVRTTYRQDHPSSGKMVEKKVWGRCGVSLRTEEEEGIASLPIPTFGPQGKKKGRQYNICSSRVMAGLAPTSSSGPRSRAIGWDNGAGRPVGTQAWQEWMRMGREKYHLRCWG